jgi:hypothetical protein
MPAMATDQNLSLAPLRPAYSSPVVFGTGAAIGVLGGMIGLGAAEFRLPLLISLFGFAALSAVILNKAMSLVVVLVALAFRQVTPGDPGPDLVNHPVDDLPVRHPRPAGRSPRYQWSE